MQESSTNDTTHPAVLAFRQDLEQQLREHVREAIETVLEAELTAALARLVVTDGHAGLKQALGAWAPIQMQRCTTHTGRNLAAAFPCIPGPKCSATIIGSFTRPMGWRPEPPTTRSSRSGRRSVRPSSAPSKRPASIC